MAPVVKLWFQFLPRQECFHARHDVSQCRATPHNGHVGISGNPAARG